MPINETCQVILFVCSGNTCRSPMAKALLQHKLSALGRENEFLVDSAAGGHPTYDSASVGAREAIKRLTGADLLADHKAKPSDATLINRANIVLTMSESLKTGLPVDKTWTLKEFAGERGDISDPFGGDLDTYLATAIEISSLLDKIIPKL